uniref:RING-type domain-containing protein n=1 Tax=Pyrodinium bahamense TaxID=73915 RepID=A0A7S0FNV6_9DINO
MLAPEPTVVPPPPPKRHRPAGGSCEIPIRAHAGQLMDPDLYEEFVCRICLDLCEISEVTLLPCSHIFCRPCLRSYLDWVASRSETVRSSGKVTQGECPTCRRPFTREQAHMDSTSPAPVSEWLQRVPVRCAFAPSQHFPEGDDPLPAGHMVRLQGLSCDWVGSLGSYSQHLQDGCRVAAKVRKGGNVESALAEGGTSALSTPLAGTPCHSTAAGDSAAGHVEQSRTPDVQQSTPGTEEDARSIGPTVWRTGDFVVAQPWQSSERWGNEAALCVDSGDRVYISEVDGQEWAQGLLTDGRRGWLPFLICRRQPQVAVAAYEGDEARGYCRVKPGDELEVYHREGPQWCYGARLPRPLPTGGSPQASMVVGWFPTAILPTT